ncbi:unnamed protein product [Musa textilis]
MAHSALLNGLVVEPHSSRAPGGGTAQRQSAAAVALLPWAVEPLVHCQSDN